jgi:hypothetical protein
MAKRSNANSFVGSSSPVNSAMAGSNGMANESDNGSYAEL